MKTSLRGFLLISIFSAASMGAEIRGKAGPSEIVITTTERLAGAIHSLTWNGREFIDSVDHGRQLQSASNLDCGKPIHAETFNPTEAGSRLDGAGPKSSSRPLSMHAFGPELKSTTQMAFWLAPEEESGGRKAYNTTVLSNHLLTKKVHVGYRNLSHAIEYEVVFTLPKGEHHTQAVFEALTGYMPAGFDAFWTFNPANGKIEPLSDGPGEQELPVILSTGDGSHAMGIFAPPGQDAPGAEQIGYGRFRFKAEQVNKWNCVFRVHNAQGVAAGEYRYRMFAAVGTLDDVKRTLGALAREFPIRKPQGGTTR